MTNDEYKRKCKLIHDNFYDYSQTIMVKKRDYIEVGCPIHGSYKVRADHHERGVKCRNCNQGNPYGIFSTANARAHKKEWLQIPAWLYFLEINSGIETFYKVGLIVKEDIKNRIKELPKHFKVKVLFVNKGNLYEHTFSETKIIEDFKSLKYCPEENFRGKQECFKENPLEYYYNYK